MSNLKKGASSSRSKSVAGGLSNNKSRLTMSKRTSSDILKKYGKAPKADHAEVGLHRFFPEHRGFKPGQEKVVRALLKGESAAAIFPTGGGKSLCYQLPGLMLSSEGLTLVVSPLLALMKDQVDSMQKRGHPVDLLGSSLTLDEKIAVKRRVSNRETAILYVAPEQLNNESSIALIRSVPLALLAIDEAHCISEWGHAFRPDYLRLAKLRHDFGAKRVVALTATATPKVQADICDAFGVIPENCVRTAFYRPNLQYVFSPTTPSERDAKLIKAIRSQAPGATIVYATIQKTTVEVAETLKKAGIDARSYHAGMTHDARKETQEWFMQESKEPRVVVATIAFGMGVDKRDIRYVYHYNLPKSLEGYAQEVGRAGRDGEDSRCELFCCIDDIPQIEAFAYCAERALSHYEMARAHDLTETTVRMLLAFLDIYHNLITQGTPRYCVYKVKPTNGSHPSAVPSLLMTRSGDSTAGLLLCSHCAVKKTWAHIDVGAAASRGASSREALVAVITRLEQQGLLEVQASQVQYVYRIQKTPSSLTEIAEHEFQRFQAREKQELARLSEVLEFITAKDCHAKILTEHFEGKGGPSHASNRLPFPCGTCQYCKSGSAISLPKQRIVKIDPDLWKLLESNAELPRDDPHLVARFALGFSSPRIAKLKLNKHQHFGLLEGTSYEGLMAFIMKTIFRSQT